jgi:hypothetical protein
MIAKQQLENAARAMGYEVIDTKPAFGVYARCSISGLLWFNPEVDKADLLDLLLVLDIDTVIGKSLVIATHGAKRQQVSVTSGNNHAALAEAAISVASQIWESKQ